MMRSRRQKTILDAFQGSRFKIRIGEKITDSEFVKVLREVMLKLEMRSINLSEQSNTLRDCRGQMLISVRDAFFFFFFFFFFLIILLKNDT